MVPDRAGADTRVDVTIPLSDLLGMDGASVIEDTWLRARAGEHGYLSGKDAEAVAYDALIVPAVTGAPDWAVIAQMISLVANAYASCAATGRHRQPNPLANRPPGLPSTWRPRPESTTSAVGASTTGHHRPAHYGRRRTLTSRSCRSSRSESARATGRRRPCGSRG
jgi:hypothetical protein